MRRIERVVVSGATSFLGSATVSGLLALGCEVYGIVRPDSKARYMLPSNTLFHEVPCDIVDAEKWANEIGRADTFLHFAWGGPGILGRSNESIQRLSGDYTLQALKYAGEMGVERFFVSGSQAEYGPIDGLISEDAICHPVLEYGKNKLRVCLEAPPIAQKLGMEYIHARFFSVYGPRDHPYALIPSCIRCFLQDESMELSECRNKWNFLHVDDAARAVLSLVKMRLTTPSLLVNIASTDTRILREFVEEIHELCGKRGSCAFGTRKVIERQVDNWPDISRLQSMINWEPCITFTEGINRLIQIERCGIIGAEV